jgi:MFS family permease
VRRTSQAVLVVACATHFLHDGFADIVYILLPLWAAEFHLSFAEVGFLRTLYSGGMALFQIPAGLLAERFGERIVLAAGTAVTAAGFATAGWAGGFLALGLVRLGRAAPARLVDRLTRLRDGSPAHRARDLQLRR